MSGVNSGSSYFQTDLKSDFDFGSKDFTIDCLTYITPHKCEMDLKNLHPTGDGMYECPRCKGTGELTTVTKINDGPETRTPFECNECKGEKELDWITIIKLDTNLSVFG